VQNFIVVPFLLLDVKSSLAAWRATNFYALYLIFVPFVLLNLAGGLSHLKRLQRQRDAKVTRKLTKEEEEQERKRVEWEKHEEKKAQKRGQGFPSMGMDFEGVESADEGEGVKKEL
jgi:lysophospholipid acyltransferase